MTKNIISNKDKNDEIKRLTSLSYKYLVGFLVIWGGILYYILGIDTKNNTSLYVDIINNLSSNIQQIFMEASVIVIVFSVFILVSIIFVLAILLRNTTLGIQEYLNRKDPFDKLLQDKQNNLNSATAWGYITTILLVLFILIVIAYRNTMVRTNAINISKIIVVITILYLFIIEPILNLIKRIKNKNNLFWALISLVLSVYVIVIYSLVLYFKVTPSPPFLMMFFVVFVVLLPIKIIQISKFDEILRKQFKHIKKRT